MLPDPLRLLISAYASGDLSPRRRSAAVRLLRHSSEARRLLKDLKINRRRLRALPKPALPADFVAKLLDKLPDQTPIIRPSVLARPVENRLNRASRIIAAVAVIVAVAVGSYLFGSLPRRDSIPNRAIAARPSVKTQTSGLPSAVPETSAAVDIPDEPAEPPAGDSAIVAKPPEPLHNPVMKPADPLGTISRPPPKLMRVDPPRILMLPIRDLNAAEGRQNLQQSLRKADVHHIDLFCKDSAKAFERLQAAIRGRGIKLVVDPLAQETLKRKLRSQYLIYCDDLSAAEWTQVLETVAAADKKPNEGLFDRTVVLPFDPSDQNELTTIFGADLSQSDVRRLGAGGADSRRDEKKKEVRQAFAGTLFPRRSPANSKEVRQFLDSHRDRAEGDIAVLLVLRLAGI